MNLFNSDKRQNYENNRTQNTPEQMQISCIHTEGIENIEPTTKKGIINKNIFFFY